MAILTLNGGWYPSSSDQRSPATLRKGLDQGKAGRGENLRSAGPGRKLDPDGLRGRWVDALPRRDRRRGSARRSSSSCRPRRHAAYFRLARYDV